MAVSTCQYLPSSQDTLKVVWNKILQRGRKQREQWIGIYLGAFTFSIFESDFYEILFLLGIVGVHPVRIPHFSIRFCFLLRNHFLYKCSLCQRSGLRFCLSLRSSFSNLPKVRRKGSHTCH